MTRIASLSTFSLLSAFALTGPALAELTDLGLVTDLNKDGLAFGGTDVFGGGDDGLGFFTADDTATLGGNDIAAYVIMDGGSDPGGGVSVPTANGGTSANAQAADSVFSTIGNTSGRLENGNVIRASVWVRQDPTAPIMVSPQIEPVLKLEFWQTALDTNADFTGGVDNPGFGERIFDTDQNGTATTIPDVSQQAQWADWDNNGSTSFSKPISVAAVTDEWRLFEHTYTVDDSTWAIGGVTKTVADVEEVRPVVFFGDFAGTDLSPGGTFLMDNFQLEVFANTGAVTANLNPDPDAVGSITGDYNDSGQVEQGDLDLVLQNWGVDTDTAGVPAGWTNDLPAGQIEQTELDGVLQNWGNTAAPDFSGSAVPEPTTLALLGGLALLATRRR